ncbi:regulator of chromosome condensation 1/beta-lactamase-inhibitor protein II [Lipomyces japonicus]|uniref:regulator of chromosome condensation 1/beta-lactamase-inhibitor protein II n=1 Tax=Lipomyces japonicus TaxID=56871 RepID=UPI0034CEDE8A
MNIVSRTFCSATRPGLGATSVRTRLLKCGIRTIHSTPARHGFRLKNSFIAGGILTIGAGAFLLTNNIDAEQKLADIGVFTWGYNGRKVVLPGSQDDAIKTPQSIPYFEGAELRDLVLGDDISVAVTANGDLVQWGNGYDPTVTVPEVVLAGKNIIRAVISQNTIYALTAKGDKIFSIPGSKAKQLELDTESETKRWYFSIFSSFSKNLAFKTINVPLQRSETVQDIVTGSQHALILTSKGRVFSAVTGSNPVYSTEGQLGVPILLGTDQDNLVLPEKVHEIVTLRGIEIVQIAAGSFHSVVRDNEGHVWTFGSNAYGQLGIDFTIETAFVPIPSLVPLDRLYNTRGLADTVCKYIAAGGDNTYFSVENKKKNEIDLWVSGSGLFGQHGTGRFMHMQGTPIRVKSLSGLKEFVNDKSQNIPIKSISIGKKHVAVVLDNAKSDNGEVKRELLLWGGNDWFQLGNGKRSQLARPTHVNTFVGSDVDKLPRRGGEFTDKRQNLTEGTSRQGKRVEATITCGNYNTAVYWKVE